MNPDLKQLYIEFEILKKKIDNFSRSSDIDRNVETAFIERLGSVFLSAQSTGSASTQNIAIASTPTNITVPAQPSGTIAIIYKGNTYNLLYA